VERAGSPQAPGGWKPALRQRVLARHDGGWFSGIIDDVSEDSVSVRWEADQRVSELGLEQIIPHPPYAGTLKRGDFVLARPLLVTHAWAPVKVVAVSGAELEIANVNGDRRRLTARDVVPLRSP
jgi:hypothetical protein